MNVPFSTTGIESDAARSARDSQSTPSGTQEKTKDLPTALQILSFAASTFADTAIVLAVLPLLLLTGPSQSDTAYSIALPASIVAVSSLVGLLMTRRIAPLYWSIVTCLARAGLALMLYWGPNSEHLTGTLLSTSIALLWGLRLQEMVILAGNRSNSIVFRLCIASLPAVAFLFLLKFYGIMQPLLMPISLALYATALLTASCAAISRGGRATTGNTISADRKGKNPDLGKSRLAPYTVAYEILLSCLSNSVLVVPILLLLSDQSMAVLTLRSETAWALSGWLIGSAATILSLTGGNRNTVSVNTRKENHIELWHILFTATLGLLLFARFSALALPALFFAAAAAASLSMRVDRTWRSNTSRSISWQPALALTLLSFVSAITYLYLFPLQSALQPIHVLRNLAAVCIVPSIIAVFAWAPTRLKLLKLISYLVPLRERLHPQPTRNVSIYFTRDVDIRTALLLGWRLDSGILIVTEDSAVHGKLTALILKLGNVQAMNHEEWLSKRKNFVKHLREDEQFLIYDETSATDLDQKLSFAPDSERGAALIHKLADQRTIVVSNMVSPAQSNLVSHAAHW